MRLKLPKVSIIILNAKILDNLNRCLLSLSKTDYEAFEIIVVDCLTKGFNDWMQGNFSNVRFVHFDFDIGPACSHNIGVKLCATESKYIAFLDSDVEVTSGWLTPLVDLMEHNPIIGAVQPKLLKLGNHAQLDAGACFIDTFGFVHNEAGLEKDKVERKPTPVFYTNGAAMLLKRDFVRDMFGELCDPNYFIYYDEVDLCWRILLMGYEVVYCPVSVVYHKRGGAFLGSLPNYLVFHNTKNRFMTLLKNYNAANLIIYLPGLVLLEIAKTITLLKLNRNHASALFKGIWWNISNFRSTYARRKMVQKLLRRVPDTFVLKHMIGLSFSRLSLDFRRHYTVATGSPNPDKK